MKTYHYFESPLKIFGLPFFEKNGKLARLTDEVMQQLPSLNFFGRRCPGARLCFRTNAEKFIVKITFETFSFDVGMSIYSCQSAAILLGERPFARFAALVNPPDYNTFTFQKTICKSAEMEDVTIFLPRNEIISDIEIEVDDGADVEAPTPYRNIKPILYYGSSITEGGCSCNIFNVYNAILSNRLNVDYYNFGFSASAKGELEMAQCISDIDMSLFVYDYDRNASTADHLRRTHEPFFELIREKKPDLPIIMMSKPATHYDEEDIERRDIILATYHHAMEKGDKNVYFVDGESFYGDHDRELCTIDLVHPNDIGFLRMANILEPVVRKALCIQA